MNFTPKSKEDREGAIKTYEGISEFTIDNAFEKFSRTGSPMCEVHLKHHNSGFIIKHWVSFGDSAVAHYFAERFFNCMGFAYPESGTFEPRDLIGKIGTAEFEYKTDERTIPQNNLNEPATPKKYLKVKEFLIDTGENKEADFNDPLPF